MAGELATAQGDLISNIKPGLSVVQALLALVAGDSVIPASPTPYDDEFNETTLNAKWSTFYTVGSIGLQAPTYLLAQIPAGSGAGTVEANELIVTAAGFMFQTRMRFLSGIPNSAGGGITAVFGLTTSTAKSFGVQVELSASNSTVTIVNGSDLNSTVQAVDIYSVTDWRIRIGLSGANLVAYVSPDGYNWVLIYSESFSGSGSSLGGTYPDTLVLQLSKPANVNSFGMAAWDYVRKIA